MAVCIILLISLMEGKIIPNVIRRLSRNSEDSKRVPEITPGLPKIFEGYRIESRKIGRISIWSYSNSDLLNQLSVISSDNPFPLNIPAFQ